MEFWRVNFARREFLIGLASAIGMSVFLVISFLAILRSERRKALRDLRTQENELPLALVSDNSKLANYGTPDWDWTLTSLTGQTAKFSEFRGTVVFINFWATWCIPCRAELPGIQRLFDETKGKPFTFALISDERAGTVRQYMDEMHFSFPAYVTEQRRPRVFEDPGIPVTFIMRPDGRVVYKHDGPAKWDWDGCVELLQSLSQDNIPWRAAAPDQ